jgi:hypothetical protein
MTETGRRRGERCGGDFHRALKCTILSSQMSNEINSKLVNWEVVKLKIKTLQWCLMWVPIVLKSYILCHVCDVKLVRKKLNTEAHVYV